MKMHILSLHTYLREHRYTASRQGYAYWYCTIRDATIAPTPAASVNSDPVSADQAPVRVATLPLDKRGLSDKTILEWCVIEYANTLPSVEEFQTRYNLWTGGRDKFDAGVLKNFMTAPIPPSSDEYDTYVREVEIAMEKLGIYFTPTIVSNLMELYERLHGLSDADTRELVLHFWRKPKATEWILVEILLYCIKVGVGVYDIVDGHLDWIRGEIRNDMLRNIRDQLSASFDPDNVQRDKLEKDILAYRRDLRRLSRQVCVNTDHEFTHEFIAPLSGHCENYVPCKKGRWYLWS